LRREEERGGDERVSEKERPVTMATAAPFITSLLPWKFLGLTLG
jgi:hypothetical protein